MPASARSRRAAICALLLLNASPAATSEESRLTSAERLHPDVLVEAVVESNPALPAARSAARAAGSRVEPAGALDDPMLSVTAAPRSFADSAMGAGASLEISQRLPWPGKLRLQETIAELEATAVRQSIAGTRLDLIRLAKEAFADWHVIHAALAVNQANRRLWLDVRELAEINYANGTGARQDVLQADLEYQSLDQRRIVLERQRTEVSAQLNRLLNRAPGAALPPPAELPAPEAPEPLAQLHERALAHRSELDAAEAELAAARARVELADREFYPDFQVSTGYNRMWADEDMRWTVGVGLSIPLDRGKRRAVAAGARAEALERRWRRADLSLQIGREVEEAHARVLESLHLLELLEDRLLPLARANLEAARTAYQSRTGSLDSLLRAERGLFETELNHETARADHYRSVAALERAVGAEAPGRSP